MALEHNHGMQPPQLVAAVQSHIVTSAEIQPVLGEMLDIFVDMHARPNNLIAFLEHAYFSGRKLDHEAKRHVM